MSNADLCARLSAQRPQDQVAAIAHAALAQRSPRVECSRYFAALETALREEPPPFGTEAYADLYRMASADGRWMAISLMTNSEREGDGAKRLWSLAACSSNEDERRQLKRHAVDESRHALAYLVMLDIVFPGAVSPTFRSELNTLSPGYAMDQELVAVEGSPYAKEPSFDDFIQMNIAEIRTAIHHLMQRPALRAHCAAEELPRIATIQEALLRDELHHVAYTAVLIDKRTHDAAPDRVNELFCKRFRDFNTITTEELGNTTFDCSVACCTKRPACRAKAMPSLASRLDA